MLRNCLIGSLIFHIIILYGVGFCLPRLTVSEAPEKYFEVITTPATFSAESSETLAMGELLPSAVATPMVKQKQAEFQPVKNSNPPGESPENNRTLKTSEIAAVALETASPNEAPQSSKNISYPTGSFSGEAADSGITNGTGKPGAPREGGSDNVTANNIHGLNGNPEGSGTGGVTGNEVLPSPDVPAVKVYYPSPEYPWKAKINNWEGTTMLYVEILKNGKIGEIKIARSSGYEILDQAAKKAVKTWRYKPALKNGSPVIYYKNVDVRFQLEG